MSDETMTVEQAVKFIADAIALGRFAEREMKKMLLGAREPEPEPVAAAETPGTLDDEAAGEKAWDEMVDKTGGDWLRWGRWGRDDCDGLLSVFRRFRDLTTPAAAPRAEIDVEKVIEKAWDATNHCPEKFDHLTDWRKAHLVRMVTHIIDAVAESRPAPSPAAETRVGQEVLSRYLGFVAPHVMAKVTRDNPGECKGVLTVRPLAHSAGHYEWVCANRWDAALARWIADGRPAK